MNPYIYIGLKPVTSQELLSTSRRSIKIYVACSTDEIIQITAKHFNLTSDDITGPSRIGNIMQARHLAIYIIKIAHGRLFLEQIGKLFNRHHTTVIHAISKVEALLEVEPKFRIEFDSLIKAFKS